MIERRSRAYDTVNSTPYSRITDDTYTHNRNTTAAESELWILVNCVGSRMYYENPSSASRHSSPVNTAPGHTSMKRTLAFGTK